MNKLRKIVRWSLRIFGGLFTICLLMALAGWLYLRQSLPKLSGEVVAHGLSSQVTVQRDALGVPTIAGQTFSDVTYAIGFLHAQERFFQMDLMRRIAAGEVSELIGESVLRLDRRTRLHRFRVRAREIFQNLPKEDQDLLSQYAKGVNDGLDALSARPFEYALLRKKATPWKPEDSFLVVFAMYLNLQSYLFPRELARGYVAEHTSLEQRELLLPTSSRWDAFLDENKPDSLNRKPWTGTAPVWFGANTEKEPSVDHPLRKIVGSNNWAVSGKRTSDGRAMVANDMHLGLQLPPIWFRAALSFYSSADAKQKVELVGVTLPGAPVMVTGSNHHVAWGFTNSYGDYLDLVEIKKDPSCESCYFLDDEKEQAKVFTETLFISGKDPETLEIHETSLGPVLKTPGRFYAVRWIAYDPQAVNLKLLRLAYATTLQQALEIGNQSGIPAQNMLVADEKGNIGWTIAGPIPGRIADVAATFPMTAKQARTYSWFSRLPHDDYPRLINPQNGQLWTANSRQFAGLPYALLGDGGADPGPRAKQIRDALSNLQNDSHHKVDERAVYEVSLDDRALYLAGWRQRMLSALDETAIAGSAKRAEFRSVLLQKWSGRASPDSAGYRLTREFIEALYEELFGSVDAEMSGVFHGVDFDSASSRWLMVVEELVEQQPPGWVPQGKKDFRAVLLAAIDRVIAKLDRQGIPLHRVTWGQRNTARIVHPFVYGQPFLRYFLAVPQDALSGDVDVPKVAGPSFGQSERMVVSPGHERDGIFNMPGGQSGHPLSPYFLAGHASWVLGEATPFLPGPTEHTLRFVH